MVSPQSSSTFDDATRRQINDAVAAAERRTAAEILPVVARSSGTYERAASLTALLAGIVAYLVGGLLVDPQVRLYAFWVVFFVVLIGGSRLGWTPRLFISDAAMERMTTTCAELAYNDRRLILSDRETVLLFYVSLFERRVVVAADTHVRDAVGERFLDELGEQLQEAVQRGDAAGGLRLAVERAGEKLATALPRRVADMDERSHELVLLDR